MSCFWVIGPSFLYFALILFLFMSQSLLVISGSCSLACQALLLSLCLLWESVLSPVFRFLCISLPRPLCVLVMSLCFVSLFRSRFLPCSLPCVSCAFMYVLSSRSCLSVSPSMSHLCYLYPCFLRCVSSHSLSCFGVRSFAAVGFYIQHSLDRRTR